MSVVSSQPRGVHVRRQPVTPCGTLCQLSSPVINLEILPPTGLMSLTTHHLEKNCGCSAKSTAQHVTQIRHPSQTHDLRQRRRPRHRIGGNHELYDRASVWRVLIAAPATLRTGGSRSSRPPILPCAKYPLITIARYKPSVSYRSRSALMTTLKVA